ncbi:MAG: DNA repair protein RecN [Oscillospiraceae bacterium]|nr:DNA repair protein RecN [Oscillospiraceae bacterium]
MLRELSIENLAVIEKASVEFGGNFNVFTGETGAGKSVIIGGINAVLGGRTNKDIVRSGAPKAVISALFDDISDRVKAKLSELGFSAEDGELVLMREITSEGKSSARINGRAATAAMLREVGELLVDIHGQHENRILMNTDNQRQILDSYGGLAQELEEYRAEFRRFSKLSRRLREMQEENKNRELRTGQLTEIIEELTELGLDYGEGERLEEELRKIRDTAKIQGALFTAHNLLNGEEAPGALDLVRQSMSSFATAGAVLPEADSLYRRLEELLPELEDISSEAASLAFGADDTEEREADLEDRVSAMKHCCRKYNMDADQLVDYLEECRQELSELSGLDGEIERLSEEKHELAGRVKRMAEDISAKRKTASEKLSEEICEVLKFLNMPNVTLSFAVTPDKITINGMDEVEILISANAGEEPKPLNKTASGGELSRVMLAIKSVMAEGDDIPTMIFDEVDAGISGRTAAKVGIKLSETARKRQVLCITHLAQIAALAQTHILIEKQTENSRTYTRIKPLDFEGRKQELARIMDGGLTESGLKAAEEMLRRG